MLAEMIAEIFPESYDACGKKAIRPDLRRKGLRSTLPMGRYVSQPLTTRCESIDEVRRFLCRCKYVSDEEQFGREDYWQAPEHFEQTQKGDCDCFALWTWREFLQLGFDARFVLGRSGRYGTGHAWVQFSKDGREFLVEPMAAGFGSKLPRLSTLRYCPRLSVTWDGNRITYYSHERRDRVPALSELVAAIPEWLRFWGWCWVRVLGLLPLILYRRISSLVRMNRHRPKQA